MNVHQSSRLNAIDTTERSTGSTFGGMADVAELLHPAWIPLESVASMDDKKPGGESNLDAARKRVHRAGYSFIHTTCASKSGRMDQEKFPCRYQHLAAL